MPLGRPAWMQLDLVASSAANSFGSPLANVHDDTHRVTYLETPPEYFMLHLHTPSIRRSAKKRRALTLPAYTVPSRSTRKPVVHPFVGAISHTRTA
ncbi:hypothetical protein AURDEDRAFT_173459 [Auricularia subglabra TFB-10046 SS5]|nr:hypothetical protein AURDEDRAFT_173459 [Auricularia subglabra TFB-10046 SS5]